MKQLSNKAKYSFGIGAIGKDAIVNLVVIYLMFYITDVLGLSPAFAGTLFFVARIWDAVNDPMMGMIIDNTRSKFGKFKVWTAIGTVVNMIVSIFLFMDFEMTTGQLYVYISVMYILWGMTYTIMDVAYWSWLPNLTSNPREREEVFVIPRFFASMAGLFVGTFGLVLIDFFDNVFGGTGDRQIGFTASAIGISILFLFTIGVTVFNVPDKTSKKETRKIKFKEIGKLLFKNDQLVAYIALLLTFNLAVQIIGGIVLYYFKYVTGSEQLFSLFNLMIIAEMTALLAFPKLTKFLSRTKAYILGISLFMIGLMIIFIGGFTAPQNVVFVLIGGFALKFGSGLSLGFTTVAIADVIDYGELKFGTRSDSIIVSSQTFLMKTAMAVAGLFTGVGLKLVGYVPGAVQSAETIAGIRIMMFAIPILCVLLSLVIFLKMYKLKGTYLTEMSTKLNKTKEQEMKLNNMAEV